MSNAEKLTLTHPYRAPSPKIGREGNVRFANGRVS